MNTINGIEAIRLAHEVSKLPGGNFTLSFYKYNSTLNKATSELTTLNGCKSRSQLPQDMWNKSGDNFFLFIDADGNPKTVYRILIRFIGFPNDNFKLRKINWLAHE